MPYAVSQAVSFSLGGTAVANVTQVTINESAPTIETSDLSLADGAYKTFIPGLPDAADVTVNHIGASMAIGNSGAFICGAITFAGSTVMSSEVAYRVGELVAYTTQIRASN
jgi:hypothetical protein